MIPNSTVKYWGSYPPGTQLTLSWSCKKMRFMSIFPIRSSKRNGRVLECGIACSMHDHNEQRVWRHLDSFQLKTYLTASSPRVSRVKHGIHTVSVPWSEPNSHFTRLFESFAISLLIATQVRIKAAQLLRLSPVQVRLIMNQSVPCGMARRDSEE